MHPNAELLNKLFERLNAHDADGMAECYDDDATFQDIAFDLAGKARIRAMWDMICSPDAKGTPSDIVVSVQQSSADDKTGRAVVVDTYTYRETGRKVRNKITSDFEFEGGKIKRQSDKCHAASWASQALGGFKGFIAGRIGPIRRKKAMKKLNDWIEYRKKNPKRTIPQPN